VIGSGFLNAVVVHGLYNFGLIAIVLLAEQPDAPRGGNRQAVILGLLVLVAIVLIGEVIWTLRIARRLRSQQLAKDYVLGSAKSGDRSAMKRQ
jgi:hypothetical protein